MACAVATGTERGEGGDYDLKFWHPAGQYARSPRANCEASKLGACARCASEPASRVVIR